MRRIHIMGASGVGTSTLGQQLAKVLPHIQLDSDDYFWEHKFTKQREINDRLTRIKQDLAHKEPWILSGAVCGWGDGLRPYFDLVIFLWIPQEIRLNRLRVREYERYGDEILPGGNKYEANQTFMEWAALYDTAGVEVRSKELHEEWMSALKCPILRIEGDLTPQERVEVVLNYLKFMESGGTHDD
ncbi:AAA family ATPase [Paenibacillus odorifer]|uniref:Adenylate kinase n=1 Tax=Paenibacillus odorifer TaxID=189426 RepID=A0A1R0Y710_9BACL|nr:AAA family ATPase [Paenibacillus odorifer]OMD43115.1 hypothetical protein BSK52_06385 [Paenibacillus odorifer]